MTLANQVDSRGAASRGRWKNTAGFACRTAAAERRDWHAKRAPVGLHGHSGWRTNLPSLT